MIENSNKAILAQKREKVNRELTLDRLLGKFQAHSHFGGAMKGFLRYWGSHAQERNHDRIGLVLGSGCEKLLDLIEVERIAESGVLLSGDVTRSGRKIQFAIGTLRGVPVAVSTYRPHCYQLIGNKLAVRHSEDSAVMADYNHPGLLRHWIERLVVEMAGGCNIILVSAVGSITEGPDVGHIVRMSGFNRLFFDEAPFMRAEHVNPLNGLGSNEHLVAAFEEFCFNSQSGLVERIPAIHYMRRGPGFETPSEVKMLRALHDLAGHREYAVAGMSTLPELLQFAVINAALHKLALPLLNVLPVAVATNGAGDPDVDHDAVRGAIALASTEIVDLVLAVHRHIVAK